MDWTKENKDAFVSTVIDTMELFGRSGVPERVIKLWWKHLQRFKAVDVFNAFDKWVETESRIPCPADIINIIEPHWKRDVK